MPVIKRQVKACVVYTQFVVVLTHVSKLLVFLLAMAVWEVNAFQMENFTEQKTTCATNPVAGSFIFKGIPALEFQGLGLEYWCDNEIKTLSELCQKLGYPLSGC